MNACRMVVIAAALVVLLAALWIGATVAMNVGIDWSLG